MTEGKFGTAINCMDGRVQEPILMWFKIRNGIDFTDTITEAGPVKALAEGDGPTVESIKNRLSISVNKHHSQLIAVVGHHDCAGNPVSKEIQLGQIEKAVEKVRSWWPGIRVVGLWVNEMWTVDEIV